MDLLRTLARDLDSTLDLPVRWRRAFTLGGYATMADLQTAIARLDDESDAVIRALLSMPLDDSLVSPVLLAGLRRLIYLCRGRDRMLLDDLVTEVAVAIGELRRVRPAESRRRLGYVIVDRGRDRQRATLRRQRACLVIDPVTVNESLSARGAGVEETVLDRLELDRVRRRVAEARDRGLTRSWNSLVDLVDEPRLSRAERDRWKYIRRRLTGHLGPDAA